MSKEKKKGKGIIGVITAVIVLVLLGAFLVVIILEGIVEIISEVIGAIIDFLKNIWYYISEFGRIVNNAFADLFDTDNYKPPEPEYICIILPDTYIEQMKTNIEGQGIDLKAADLRDIMLKKMFLTSYRTMATNRTELAMKVSDEDYSDLKDEDSGQLFYKKEIDGEKYMATLGIIDVKIYAKKENGDESLYDMYSYTPATLKGIIEEYENEEEGDYKDAIKRWLEYSYTVESIGSIKINAQETNRKVETQELIYTTSSDVTENKFKKSGLLNYNLLESSRNSDTTVQYTESILEYIMPMELTTALLEITASAEFTLDVCELVDDSRIELGIYQEKQTNKEVDEKKYNLDVDIDVSGEKTEKNDTVQYNSTQSVKNSVVNDIDTIISTTKSYTGVVTEVDCWWCKAKNDVEKIKDEYCVAINEVGEELENSDDIDKMWVNGQIDSPKTTKINKDWSKFKNTSGKISDTFNVRYGIYFKDFSNYQNYNIGFSSLVNSSKSSEGSTNKEIGKEFTNKILQTEYRSKNRDKDAITVNNITETKSNVKQRQYMTTSYTRYVKKGNTQIDDNTDKFLKLLKDSSGNDVLYSDFYGDDEVKIGKLLTNGAELLFEILESFENSKETADIMRYILYRYSNEDFGITEFDEQLFFSYYFDNVTTLYGDTVQAKIWNALINEGYNEYAIAGVLGNIYKESNFNPSAKNKSSGAVGICQWLGGRKNKLISYASSKGTDWTDINTQIEFLIAELTPGGKGIADYQFYNTEQKESWLNSKNASDAAKAFCKGFERCGDNEADYTTRMQQAEFYYEAFHGTGVWDKSSGGSNTAGIYKSSSGNTYTILNQNKINGWGSKCNRAASAIIASGYSNQNANELISTINSKYTGAYFGAIPGNNYWNSYGLQVTKNESTIGAGKYEDNVMNHLKSGGCVMIRLNGIYYGKSGQPWTTSGNGHWLAIIDYRDSSGKETICVADYRGITWVGVDEFYKGIQYIVYVNKIQ